MRAGRHGRRIRSAPLCASGRRCDSARRVFSAASHRSTVMSSPREPDRRAWSDHVRYPYRRRAGVRRLLRPGVMRFMCWSAPCILGGPLKRCDNYGRAYPDSAGRTKRGSFPRRRSPRLYRTARAASSWHSGFSSILAVRDRTPRRDVPRRGPGSPGIRGLVRPARRLSRRWSSGRSRAPARCARDITRTRRRIRFRRACGAHVVSPRPPTIPFAHPCRNECVYRYAHTRAPETRCSTGAGRRTVSRALQLARHRHPLARCGA